MSDFQSVRQASRKLLAKIHHIIDAKSNSKLILQASGHCPTCDRDVKFVAHNNWLRDNFVCTHCGSIPRERALMVVIDSFFPAWREAVIHESSPGQGGASLRLSKECSQYIASQFFPGHRPGTMVGNMRCENLESLSFPDESVDLHITQDVLEHVFHPSRAFREIARTLKPGGMHIFTVPLVAKGKSSELRACIENNQIVYLKPEQYHGSPVGDGRALVTVDWGFDICQHIFESSGLCTHLVHIDDLSKGIRAEYVEVLVTVKPLALGMANNIP
jgi:SAM-dependent methyltransferase